MPDSAHHEAWKSLGEECVHSAIFDSAAERQPVSPCMDLPGTCLNLLDTLRNTIRGENGKIIWISGESGSGSSSMAHTFAQEARDNGALAATFFFSRRDPIRSTIDRVIPTISYQLGLLHPRAKDVITKAIVDDPQLLNQEKSRDEQFDRLVLRPVVALKNIWKDLDKAMIMLFDALDACDPGDSDSHLTQLVNQFSRALRQENSASFHVIFTSRPFSYIQNVLAKYLLVITLNMEDLDTKKKTGYSLWPFFNYFLTAQKQGHKPPCRWPSVVRKHSGRFLIAVSVILAVVTMDFANGRLLHWVEAASLICIVYQRITPFQRMNANVKVCEPREAIIDNNSQERDHPSPETSSSDIFIMQGSLIRPGIYQLVQFEGAIAIDLSGWDNTTVLGYERHQNGNQKWEFDPLGAGYSVKCIHSGRYLTCERVQVGAPVIATPYPVSWGVEAIVGKQGLAFRIMWPNSPLAITLDSSCPKTTVLNLSSVRKARQEWIAHRVG